MVDYERARNHIANTLMKSGLNMREIGDLSGTGFSTVQRIVLSRHKQIDKATEQAILRVTPRSVVRAPEKRVRVPETRAKRMLQALQCIGWSRRAMMRRLEISEDAIDRLLRRKDADVVQYINKATEAVVVQNFDDMLSYVDGTNAAQTQAKHTAQRRGFLPASAWTPETIADPDATGVVQEVQKTVDKVMVQRAYDGGGCRWGDLTHEERVELVRNSEYTATYIERTLGGAKTSIQKYIDKYRDM